MSAPRKSSLLIVFLVVFIDLLGFGIVLPLLPRYGKHFLADGWVLGGLMAAFSAMQFVFAPLWGRLSDRIGRRPVLMLGLAGSVLFYGLFGFVSSMSADSLWLGLGPIAWLMISRIGAGIAGATIPTAQAYIADCTGAADRGKGMALIGAAFGMGFTFGPLLAAVFASNDLNAPPSSAPGYVASGLSALALIGAFFRLPETLSPESRSSHRRWLDVGALSHALTQPALGALLITMFLATFAFAQFESTLSLLTRSLNMSERDNFYVFAYLGFVLTLAQGVLVRRILPRIGEYKCAIAGSLLLTVGFLLVSMTAPPTAPRKVDSAATTVATGSVVAVAGDAVKDRSPKSEATTSDTTGKEEPDQAGLLILFSILPISIVGFAMMNPALQSMLSLRTSSGEQGEVLGLGQSMSAMARILGPVSGIVLIEHNPRYPYWTASAAMLLSLFLVVTLRKPRAASCSTTDTTESEPVTANARPTE